MGFTKLFTALTVVAIGISVAGQAMAHGWDKVSRYDIMTNEKLQKRLNEREIMELHRYFNYQHREPCQQYDVAMPEGFKIKDCALWAKDFKMDAHASAVVHFASDSAALSASEKAKVVSLAKKAKKMNARKVKLSGFTDTAADKDYNMKLSKKRVKAVKKIFKDHGISCKVLKSKYYGESRLAVKTNDGVSNHSNRRVEIEIR
jgi:outer membrane protein OmpA-like peptidoglycan-associated protein